MSKRIEPPSVVAEEKSDESFFTYELKKPILSYGEPVTVIRMREPTAEDVLVVGDPVVIYMYEDPVRIEYDMAKVIKMVARLSSIPSQSLAKMSSRELKGLAMTISPFFTPA